jgi:hypothetical protein
VPSTSRRCCHPGDVIRQLHKRPESENGTTFDPAGTIRTDYDYSAATGLLDQVDDKLISGMSTTVTAYTYTDLAQLDTIDDPLISGSTDYAYDTAGRLSGRTDPAGLTWTRAYQATTGRVDTQTIKLGSTNLVSSDRVSDRDIETHT